MTYYYSNEDDRVFSEDEVRSFWLIAREDGDSFLTATFDRFLEGCMWWNNGDLTRLDEHVSNLRRKLARSTDEDETATLSAMIAEYDRCYLEV